MGHKIEHLLDSNHAPGGTEIKRYFDAMVDAMYDEKGKKRDEVDEAAFISNFEKYFDVSRRGTLKDEGLLGEGNPIADEPNQDMGALKGDYKPWFGIVVSAVKYEGEKRQHKELRRQIADVTETTKQKNEKYRTLLDKMRN
ncbi:hypothetical protein ACFLYT_01580 [Nanoarchaeota archaeon]